MARAWLVHAAPVVLVLCAIALWGYALQLPDRVTECAADDPCIYQREPHPDQEALARTGFFLVLAASLWWSVAAMLGMRRPRPMAAAPSKVSRLAAQSKP